MAPNESEGGVWVTTQDIYREVTGMRDDLNKGLQTLEDAVKSIGDHETRIRKLERWMWALPIGAVLALAGVVGNHFHVIGG